MSRCLKNSTSLFNIDIRFCEEWREKENICSCDIVAVTNASLLARYNILQLNTTSTCINLHYLQRDNCHDDFIINLISNTVILSLNLALLVRLHCTGAMQVRDVGRVAACVPMLTVFCELRSNFLTSPSHSSFHHKTKYENFRL